MALSNDLIQEFASVMGNAKEKHVDTTCYGKVTRMESSTNGFIQLDGADTETPASFTVGAHVNDRVLAILKNRSALVIGNITHPVIMTGTLYASDAIVVEGYLTTNASRTRYNDTSNNGITFDANGIGAYSNLSSWWLKNDGTFQFGGENGITFSDNKVRFGSDVVVGWGNIPDKPAIPTDIADLTDNDSKLWTTAIADTWIETSTVYAQNLQVDMAKVQGDLQVSRITGPVSGTAYSGANPWSIDFKNGTITIGDISASSIKAGYISVDRIQANSIPNGKLSGSASGTAYSGATAWSIDFNAGTITIGDISASSIKAGYISVDRIQGNSIPNSKLSGTITGRAYTGATAWEINLAAGTMTLGQISADKITTGTLTVGGTNNGVGSITIKNASDGIIGSWNNTGITAEYGTIAGWKIEPTALSKEVTISETVNGSTVSAKYKPYIQALANPTASNTAIGVTRTVGSSTTWPFVVYYDGSLLATKANITGVLTATSLTATETITLTKSGQNNATFKYTAGSVANGTGYGWDNTDGWNSNGIVPSGTTPNFTLSVPLYVNGKVEVNGRLQANGDLDIGNHILTGRYIYSDYIYATGLRVGSPTGEPQVWAHITGANTKIYMYVNADGRRGLYSTTRGGTSHSILSFADNSTTGTFYGNCSGSSGSCTGNAATATTAASCSGHAASDVPLAGNCTVTGYLYVNSTLRSGYSTLNDNIAVQTENSKHKIGLRILADGTAGLYSYTKDMWLLNMDTNGVVWARTAHVPSTKSMYRIVGSSDTDGIRVGMIRYGNTSGQFDVYAQSGTAGSGFSWRTPSNSDIRLKENIKESSVDSLSVLNRIPLYEFDWKESKKHWSIGFIANYMNEIDPLLAHITTAEDEYSSINTFYMQGHIVKAIQQLTARIEELEKKLKGAA